MLIRPTESACAAGTATVTVTMPYGVHTPSAPASAAPTIAPYPTMAAPYPSVVPSGVVPSGSVPSGSMVPSGAVPSGTAAPSASGGYSTAPAEFTNAAGSIKITGFVAGVGAFAAFFL
jgi:hypothetical protein